MTRTLLCLAFALVVVSGLGCRREPQVVRPGAPVSEVSFIVPDVAWTHGTNAATVSFFPANGSNRIAVVVQHVPGGCDARSPNIAVAADGARIHVRNVSREGFVDTTTEIDYCDVSAELERADAHRLGRAARSIVVVDGAELVVPESERSQLVILAAGGR